MRGAPAIAIVGCLSIAVGLNKCDVKCVDELHMEVCKMVDHVVTARPTAVNMQLAGEQLKSFSETVSHSSQDPGIFKEKSVFLNRHMLSLYLNNSIHSPLV